MDATNYLQGQLSGWIAEEQSFDAPPTNIYIALHDADPGDDAANNELDPNNGYGGYTRYQSTVSTDWSETSAGEFQNSVDIVFNEATENWGEITHFSLWDGPDPTDNALGQDSMVTSVTVEQGDAPVFRDGNLSGSFE
jgi:hypothetical protein